MAASSGWSSLLDCKQKWLGAGGSFTCFGDSMGAIDEHRRSASVASYIITIAGQKTFILTSHESAPTSVAFIDTHTYHGLDGKQPAHCIVACGGRARDFTEILTRMHSKPDSQDVDHTVVAVFVDSMPTPHTHAEADVQAGSGSSNLHDALAPTFMPSHPISTSSPPTESIVGDASPDEGVPASSTPSGPEFSKHTDFTDTCSLCCCEHSGCAELLCGHGRLCHLCMNRWTESRLEGGNADVPCPCAESCELGVPHWQLRMLVEPITFDKLLQASLNRAVLNDGTIWPCPTPDCPYCVAIDDIECPNGAPMHCPICDKDVFVGPQGSTADTADKTFASWMEATGAKTCPGCGCVVTKQSLNSQHSQRSECHKMLCRCGVRFCFKCLFQYEGRNTCKCTSADHGFVDPYSGKRVEHRAKHSRGGSCNSKGSRVRTAHSIQRVMRQQA